MATINLNAYKGRDNRENLYLTQTVSSVENGQIVKTTTAIDVLGATKLELKFREEGQPNTLAIDDTTHPIAFEPQPGGVLNLRLGMISELELGKTYQARLVLYDDGDNPNGLVVADFAEDASTDTLRVKVR
jgi:hypothetical protein